MSKQEIYSMITITQMNQIHFFVKSTRRNKTSNSATLIYKDSFPNYLKYFLDDIDNKTVKKIDFFPHKNVKYLL